MPNDFHSGSSTKDFIINSTSSTSFSILCFKHALIEAETYTKVLKEGIETGAATEKGTVLFFQKHTKELHRDNSH